MRLTQSILILIFISSLFGDTIKYRNHLYEYTTLTDVEFIGVNDGYIHYKFNKPKKSYKWEKNYKSFQKTYCLCLWVIEILDDEGNQINFDCNVNTITDFSKISPINKEDIGGGADLSFPNGMLGFYLYTTNTEKLGYYIDFRGQFSAISEKGSYNDNISINWSENLGDDRIGEETDYMMFNVGVIKNISNTMFLYGGGGISWRDNYYQYYDEFEILGKNGKYWINGDTSSKINIIGGILILPKKDDFFNQIKFGVNTTPIEISVGLGWSLFRNIK